MLIVSAMRKKGRKKLLNDDKNDILKMKTKMKTYAIIT
jgi:hypothetical protein